MFHKKSVFLSNISDYLYIISTRSTLKISLSRKVKVSHKVVGDGCNTVTITVSTSFLSYFIYTASRSLTHKYSST